MWSVWWFAIAEAARKGHLDIVKYLCEIKNDDGEYRCDPSANNNDAIREAESGGHLDIVDYLFGLTNNHRTLRWDHSHICPFLFYINLPGFY